MEKDQYNKTIEIIKAAGITTEEAVGAFEKLAKIAAESTDYENEIRNVKHNPNLKPWEKWKIIKELQSLKNERDRIRQYDCDGICYTDNSMCPQAEICPETRKKEFAGTITAAGAVIILPILVIATIALLVFTNFL